ncbi:GNAT family N-acetyltransferase [Furfurilactobacillus curtus]|uniref:N-acetyltransferase n=1 Tax=Furfurilactobacillus curtus TaxID=1746200 RepID=A0ABQ5JPH2_9LACO
MHKIRLDTLQPEQVADFWQLAFADPTSEWTKWNGPYFHDQLPSQAEFVEQIASESYINQPFRQVIWVGQQMVGLVSAYYEDDPLKRWLDIGIVIYDQSIWHQGVGAQALHLWVNQLWQLTDLPHLGLTTWSGNKRMIALAEKVGFTREATIRKVRYWQDQYWDSVKYGLLREEWLDKENAY